MLISEFQNNLINLQGSLMRFAFRLTSDKDDAADLVQDTTLKALKYFDRYLHESNLKAWTYTIMKNTFINNYRKVKLQNSFSEHFRQSALNNISSTGSDDPISAYSEKEIVENIDQLKDKLRIPLQMHIYGFTYKEIGEKLNLNIGTVKSRLFLSRKKLKDKFNN
jgi:RNA polymerase sigma factor (sigma-70 family)